MFKNFAKVKTPTTNNEWLSLSKEKRVELIKLELKKKKIDNFEIYDAPDDGRIIFKVTDPIQSNKRGLLLLDLEEQLKKKINNGLTVWLEPVGDKSKLRNLRGITFKNI